MEMDREFCPKCGNHTLQRMAYSVDHEGNVVLHQSRFKQPKLRGTKVSSIFPLASVVSRTAQSVFFFLFSSSIRFQNHRVAATQTILSFVKIKSP